MTTTQPESSAPISDYATTHCAICKAGWVRTGPEGEQLIICLLDREKAWRQMVECNRFVSALPPAPPERKTFELEDAPSPAEQDEQPTFEL